MYCLLKAVEAMETTLEIRDEKVAEGRIDSVDGFMNINMTDVTIKFLLNGEEKAFDSFFTNGKTICAYF